MEKKMSEEAENYYVYENKPDHHYRTEIPNIVFDLDLSDSQFRLYSQLKRIAGGK